MSKVLIITFPGEGHVNPTLAIVEELMKRGEEVTYYCIEDYQYKIEKTGAKFRSFDKFFNSNDVAKSIMNYGYSLITLNKLANKAGSIANKIIDEVKGEGYDYIIYDINFIVGKIVANSLKIPAITSCTTFAFEESMFTKAINQSEEMQKSEIYQDFLKSLNALNEEYGLHLGGIVDFMHQPGDLNIVFTSKYYQPNANNFNQTYKFVGPSIVPRKDVDHLNFKKQDNKVIFISMGTVFNQQPKLYETCFKAFKDCDADVILSVGKQTDISQLKDIPSNFHVFNYVPQLEVLQIADIFVTHGGMNSSSEGLYYGVPLVVIPAFGDQPIVAKRIEELGAGLSLDRETLTKEDLRNTVNIVLNKPKFKENSCKVGKTLKEAGGYLEAVDEIMSFKHKCLHGVD
ncbi:macrolide family glycosyltransferase [Niallia sp. 01092]|uniref:macrolide family glycosyltransferase n=1 Tax=unclassified Niallia TaxID=2837522 RepID=UPI003FD5FDAC